MKLTKRMKINATIADEAASDFTFRGTAKEIIDHVYAEQSRLGRDLWVKDCWYSRGSKSFPVPVDVVELLAENEIAHWTAEMVYINS